MHLVVIDLLTHGRKQSDYHEHTANGADRVYSSVPGCVDGNEIDACGLSGQQSSRHRVDAYSICQ